jgi:tetratricopeptide (TPR) repeat protein
VRSGIPATGRQALCQNRSLAAKPKRDSPLPRVILLSAGLVFASVLAIYAGVGGSLGHRETSAFDGLPEATRRQANQLYSSVRWQPWNSAEYLRLGMFFVANNRPEPAIEWLHRATVWSPAGYQPWYYLGLAYQEAHRTPEARTAFRKALQLNPDYIAAKVRLADLLLEENRFGDAESAYTDLVGTGADQARATFGLGTALLQGGNFRGAERNFSAALARVAAFGLSVDFKALGDDSRAAREARLARIWRFAVPLRTDDPLTETMERDFPTGLSLFQAAVRNRDPRTSTETAEQAVALYPSMTFAWEYLVGLYAQAHRTQDAVRAWNVLLKLDPNNTRGRYELAVVLTESGDRTRANALLNQVLTIDPTYSEAHRLLGVVAQVGGDREEAARQFRTAFENDPSIAEAHVDLGLLLLQEGQAKEGEAELLRALVPPADQPERTLSRELAALRGNPIAESFEQAVRAQATQRDQPSLISLLNNRKKPQAARALGIDGIVKRQ